MGASIVWGRAAYRLFKREIGKLEVFNYGEEKINTEKRGRRIQE